MEAAWRRLEPGETDHALLALGISAGGAALAGSWLAAGLPWPHCVFHALTGCPCPACGATRCALALARGHFREALGWNPLACAGFGALGTFDAYALITLAGRFPRLRFLVSPREASLLRAAAWAAILGNWAWLVHHGV